MQQHNAQQQVVQDVVGLQLFALQATAGYRP